MFSYRRQPLKTIYIIFGALFVLVRIPYWTLRNLLPSFRPRRNWSLFRAVLIEFINAATAIMLETGLPSPTPLDVMAKSADKTGFVWVESKPDLIVGDIQRFAEQNKVKPVKTAGFWYGAKSSHGEVGQKPQLEEKVAFVLHGGGFVMGSGAPSFLPNALICNGVLEHAPQFTRAFAMEYRLATGPPYEIKNPFPAALIDIIAGYRYLLDVGFQSKNITVAGDSCGGILAYQLIRYLTMVNLPEIPPPGGLLLLSPSADSALRQDPGTSMCTNTRSDYAYSWLDAAYGVKALLGHLPAAELDKPWLSPGSLMFSNEEVKGLFKDFPPTFILAGEAEMSRDSMRVLRDRMCADMGKDKVTYWEAEGAPHDFLGLSFIEPERTNALKAIGSWADTLYIES